VEKEKLQRLIEIARYALSGGNLQLVEWMMFTDADRIKEIAGLTVEWMRKVMAEAPHSVPPYVPLIIGAWDMRYNSLTWRAPVLIVASAPMEATTGMVDVSLALSYLELAAQKLGLGTCWAGLVEAAVKKSLESDYPHP
jgi:nitroreductase